jgi:hypothetical protein
LTLEVAGTRATGPHPGRPSATGRYESSVRETKSGDLPEAIADYLPREKVVAQAVFIQAPAGF